MRSNFYPFFLAATITTAFASTMAPVAVANTQDDQYLASLAAQGITGDPGQLIAAGHTACDHYGTAGVVGASRGWMGTLGISNGQAASLMMAGIRAYCPEKLGGLPIG